MTPAAPPKLKIQLHLTIGWPKIIDDTWIKKLLDLENQSDIDKNQACQKLLRKLLNKQNQSFEFHGIDHLFRRNTKGFQPIKRFFSNLITLENTSATEVHCYIDAFTFAFLKGAKNFDLFLNYNPKNNVQFTQTYQNWLKAIEAYEKLERSGIPLTDSQTQDHYLKFRKILLRPSARDELRALACLLLNGPSTMQQVSNDLGLNYSLSQRTVSIFEPCNIVENRGNDEYAIVPDSLPMAIFGLREVLGINYLELLEEYI